MDFTVLGDQSNTGLENPHREVASFLSDHLQAGVVRSRAMAVESLIQVSVVHLGKDHWMLNGALQILRDTLPTLVALQRVRHAFAGRANLLFKGTAWFRLLYDSKLVFSFVESRKALVDVVHQIRN